jgi:hypothetical protein
MFPPHYKGVKSAFHSIALRLRESAFFWVAVPPLNGHMSNPYLASTVKRARGFWSRFFLALLTFFWLGPECVGLGDLCSVN